jgi:putative transposase
MFKYKLKPTAKQTRVFERWLDVCRDLYNAALEERKLAWQRRRVMVSAQMQKAELPDLKRAIPELAEVNSQVLQNVIDRVERSYQQFWRGQRTGNGHGYPRFKGKKRYHSFTYPLCGWGGVHLKDDQLTLSRIGTVRVRLHRPIEGCPKTVTILREMDGWYCLISCDQVPIKPLPKTGKEIGIDFGLLYFVTLDDGTQVENPRWLRQSAKLLRRRNRRMRRRASTSKRFRAAALLVGKTFHTITNQRRDFHRKLALDLVRRYDAVYYEHLNLANMRQNKHLSKSIRDAGFGLFALHLTCKAVEAGKIAMHVAPRYTSQTCSGCGVLVPKGWRTRWHDCPECGTSLDRDQNAARNILHAGQRKRAGQTHQAPTKADTPSVA